MCCSVEVSSVTRVMGSSSLMVNERNALSQFSSACISACASSLFAAPRTGSIAEATAVTTRLASAARRVISALILRARSACVSFVSMCCRSSFGSHCTSQSGHSPESSRRSSPKRRSSNWSSCRRSSGSCRISRSEFVSESMKRINSDETSKVDICWRLSMSCFRRSKFTVGVASGVAASVMPMSTLPALNSVIAARESAARCSLTVAKAVASLKESRRSDAATRLRCWSTFRWACSAWAARRLWTVTSNPRMFSTSAKPRSCWMCCARGRGSAAMNWRTSRRVRMCPPRRAISWISWKRGTIDSGHSRWSGVSTERDIRTGSS